MEKYNAKRIQQIVSGCILNQIIFEFEEKSYELKYDIYECTLTEFDEKYIPNQIFSNSCWSNEKFKKDTYRETLGDVCDEIYAYHISS